MTQSTKQQNTQVVAAASDNLPVEPSSKFVKTGNQKVQLDLEDAPFLDEEKKKSSELATTESGELADLASDKTANSDEEQKSKSKKKIIIIGCASVLLLLAILAGVYFLFFAEKEKIVMLQNIIVVPTPPTEEIPLLYQVELAPFWIDLKNRDDGVNFLVGTFILSVETKSIRNEIETNMKIVRDAIYYYLINTNPDFLVDYKNTEKIKAGITEIVDQYIIHGGVNEIYFDSFLVK